MAQEKSVLKFARNCQQVQKSVESATRCPKTTKISKKKLLTSKNVKRAKQAAKDAQKVSAGEKKFQKGPKSTTKRF